MYYTVGRILVKHGFCIGRNLGLHLERRTLHGLSWARDGSTWQGPGVLASDGMTTSRNVHFNCFLQAHCGLETFQKNLSFPPTSYGFEKVVQMSCVFHSMEANVPLLDRVWNLIHEHGHGLAQKLPFFQNLWSILKISVLKILVQEERHVWITRLIRDLNG